MNRRRLLVIGTLAAVVGGFTSRFVYLSLTRNITPGVDVVIAARDLQPGDRISDRDLRVVQSRDQFLPSAVLHKKEPAIGRAAMFPISEGEFLLPVKISIGPAGNPLTAQIPVHMRAVQLPVNELDASSIKPGDRVDVLVTGNAPGRSDVQTRTVLPDVRLLAVGSTAVTVVASPEDAEKLTLAMQEGRIKLVFRNPVDNAQETTPVVTSTTLYGVSQPKKATVKLVSPVPKEPGYEIQVIPGTAPPKTIKFKQ